MIEKTYDYPSQLKEFMMNLPPEKRGGNLYMIETFDMDDNLVETNFGVNVLTNTGFENCYKNTYNYSLSVAFGNGTGTPAITDTKLFSILPNHPCYVDNVGPTFPETAQNSAYNAVYDPATNSLIGRKLTGTVTMDYNYSWLTEDTVITEFGEYYQSERVADYTLRTHSLVYNAAGEVSSFTKRLNEKVVISIFKGSIINCDIFSTLYDQGKYFFVHPSYIISNMQANETYRTFNYRYFFSGRLRTENDFPLYPITPEWSRARDSGAKNPFNTGSYTNPGNIFSQYNNNYSAQHYSFPMDVNGTPNIYRYYIETTGGFRNNCRSNDDFVITDKDYVKTGIFIASEQNLQNYYDYLNYDGGYKQRSMLFYMEKINLSTPEEITVDRMWTDSFLSTRFSNGFAMRDLFGDMNDNHRYDYYKHQLGIPCTDLNITSVKRYNSLTDSYDDEQFTNDATYDFRNPERLIWGYLSFDNHPTYDVFINTTPEVDVMSFADNEDGFKIYVTDTFWDPTSYTEIPKGTEVPVGLRNKRYFIKSPSRYATLWSTQSSIDVITMKSGIHPTRRENNHALVLSSQPESLNCATMKPVTSDYDQITVHASDNGWVYCREKVIYPESSDESGKCYVKTTADDITINLDTVRCTSTSIFMTIHEYIYFYNNEHLNTKIFRVVKPDPTNPSNDLVKWDYIYNDVKTLCPNLSGTGYPYESFVFNEDPINDKMYIYRQGYLLYIDYSESEKNLHLVNKSVNYVYSIIYDSSTPDLLVQRTSDYSKSEFEIFKSTTGETISTFDLGVTGATISGIMGYANMIYIQLQKDSVWYIYTYDMLTGNIVAHMNWFFNFVYYNDTYRYRNSSRRISFTDDSMLISSPTLGDTSLYNYGTCLAVFFKDNLDSPTFLSDQQYKDKKWNNFSDWFIRIAMNPYIKKFNNGKDYVVAVNGFAKESKDPSDFPDSTTLSHTYFIDIGYIKNHPTSSISEMIKQNYCPAYNMPASQYDIGGYYTRSEYSSRLFPNQSNDTPWFAATCFYKNKVLVFFNYQAPMLVPIELFLPHKITGTSKTVQCYNNPKLIKGKNYGLVITNDV